MNVTPVAAPLPIDPRDQPLSQRLWHNLEVALRSGSTWVVLVSGALAAGFLRLGEQQQQSLVDSIPLLAGGTPVVIAMLTFVVTKLRPSNAVSAQTRAYIEEIARLKLEAWAARAHDDAAWGPAAAAPAVAAAAPAVVRDAVLPHAGNAPSAATPAQPPRAPAPAAPAADAVRAPLSSPRYDIDPRLLLSLVREYLEAQLRHGGGGVKS